MSNARNLANLLGTSTTIAQDKISSDVSFGVSSYNNISTLPLSGNDIGDQAFVDSDNRLYIWNGSGWYNIALINTSPSITGGYESSYKFETDGTPIVITLVGSDPEGIPLTWTYEVTAGSLTNGGGVTATVSNVDNVFTITPSTTEDYAGSFSLTFKASDGVNIATAVSSFTLVFNVVNSRYTTLLAKGASATQNATFADSSTNNHAITTIGSVYQGTFSPYRTGGYSMYFDGSSYLNTPAHSSFQLGANDFTVEAWINTTDANSIICNFGANELVLYNGFSFSVVAGKARGILNASAGNNSNEAWVTSTTTVSDGNWHHVLYTRSSGTFYIFVDGILEDSITQDVTFWAPTTDFYIGAYLYNSTPTPRYTGYISNFRLINGSGLYTSNFNLPTVPLTKVANTSLLINTPYIADSSTNAHAITVNGNTSTKPFGPFDYKRYDSSLYGSSAYFELSSALQFPGAGVTDWGTGDFTVETWIYAPSGTTSPIKIIECRPAGTNGPYANFAYQPDIGIFSVYVETARRIETSTSYPGGNWYHVAYVQYNSVLTIYVNGKADGSWANTTTWSTRTDPGINIKAFTGESNYGTVYLSDYRIVKGTALYTSDFTPPTAPLTAITNTSLLLNFTNAGIQDYSQVSDLKLVGNATGSNTQTKYASYSMSFDGTNAGVLFGDTTTLQFLHDKTVDYTLEAWVYPTSSSPTRRALLETGAASASAGALWELTSGVVNYTIYRGVSGSFTIVVGGTPTLNTWSHLAISVANESGTVYLRAFLNGSLVNTTTWSLDGSTSNSNVVPTIANDTAGGVSDFIGYIEDLRITKGLARYTANFTPPTTELLG